MSKHTPGPWRLQFLGNYDADLIHKGTFAGINAGSGAPEKLDADEFATWEVNARLIEAAPDLLETLRLVAKGLRQGAIPDQTLLTPSKDNSSLDMTPLSKIVYAAIAKAVGE